MDDLPANSAISGMIDGKTVTAVTGGAFANCGTLISVTIPDNVTEIDAGAFESCMELTRILMQKEIIFL